MEYFEDHTDIFSIVFEVILSSSDRHKIFTTKWHWIEVCKMQFKV